MIAILSALGSLLSFRVRSASLEHELVALRHQVTVLRRQRPGQLRLFSTDRLHWVWLYRVWRQVLNAMVLVKPATVVQWHRKGFRLAVAITPSGTAPDEHEIRDLIRRMSLANPRHRGQPSHGREIPAVAAQSPLPSLA
jgi:putative transposase